MSLFRNSAMDVSSNVTAHTLFTRFWEWRLKENPEFATFIGIHKYDDKLDTYTLESFERRIKTCKMFVADAVRIASEGNLDERTSLDLDLFIALLNTYLTGMDVKGYLFPITYLDGIQLDLPELIKNMVYQSPDDYAKLISRLKAVPQQIQEIIDLMRSGVLSNITLHEISVKEVLLQLDYLQANVEESPFLEPFVNIPVDFDSVEKTLITSNAHNTIFNEVLPSFQKLRNFLKFEYFEHLRPNISVSSMPNGINFYSKCLRFYLGFNITPEDVHKLGIKEVERIKEEIERVIESLELNMSVSEFKFRIKDEKDFCFRTQEEIMEAYSGLIFNKIRPKLHEVIWPLPELKLSILPAPSPMAHGQSFYYMNGTPDGSKPDIFYINTQQLNACTTYEMMALALHKTEPGHHLQLRYMMELKDVPDFRHYAEDGKYSCAPSRYPSITAFIEGWGMYSEYLGYELKMYEDPYFEYGHLCYEIFRACCLVVDTGIHAFGWTSDKARQYMMENTSLSQAEVESEICRYITWPGQACACKMGEMKIKQLRKNAEMSLRDKFDLHSFHDAVLRSAGPLSFLEQNVNAYIHKEMCKN